MLYTPAPVILMTAVELDGPHIISILTGEEGDLRGSGRVRRCRAGEQWSRPLRPGPLGCVLCIFSSTPRCHHLVDVHTLLFPQGLLARDHRLWATD